MKTISVTHEFAAPIEVVFEALEDGPGYKNFVSPWLLWRANLVKPGDLELFGVGAIRSFLLPGFSFREEITGFGRPHRIDYQIRESRPAVRHDGGSFLLSERLDGGTSVRWTTTFSTGGIPGAEKIMAKIVRQAFVHQLAAIDRGLANNSSTFR